MGPLKQSLVENISFQWRNCNIFGLTDTMALFAKEAVFYRFWVFFRASSLQNDVGDPPFFFFYISDIINSSSFNSKISRKKSIVVLLHKSKSPIFNGPMGKKDQFFVHTKKLVVVNNFIHNLLKQK